MNRKHRFQNLRSPLLMAVVLTIQSTAIFVTLMSQPVSCQTFKVLHSFTGWQDGAFPSAGLSLDPEGNLYGTAAYGGNLNNTYCPLGCGTVFRLSNQDSDWVFTTLHTL
jgi:hypothetical protein